MRTEAGVIVVCDGPRRAVDIFFKHQIGKKVSRGMSISGTYILKKSLYALWRIIMVTARDAGGLRLGSRGRRLNKAYHHEQLLKNHDTKLRTISFSGRIDLLGQWAECEGAT